MVEEFRGVVVGYVRSPVTDPALAPRQGRDAGLEARIEVLPAYRAGLTGLERFERVVIVCWMHRAPPFALRVHPRGEANGPLTGVFATRSPARPSPLAVCTVELLAVDAGGLRVRGVDAVDGTPVLDIRPHILRLDD